MAGAEKLSVTGGSAGPAVSELCLRQPGHPGYPAEGRRAERLLQRQYLFHLSAGGAYPGAGHRPAAFVRRPRSGGGPEDRGRQREGPAVLLLRHQVLPSSPTGGIPAFRPLCGGHAAPFGDRDAFARFQDGAPEDYRRFREVLWVFRGRYGLEMFSWKELDRYLWQLGMELFPRKYGKARPR